MDKESARKIVNALKLGIPPTGHIKELTVGRKDEIDALKTKLLDNDCQALLLQANFGAGKTHLLHFIRELALESNYVVSMVSCDSHGGVRFNRMDQIVSAICRNIEIPDNQGYKGIDILLDWVRDYYELTQLQGDYGITFNTILEAWFEDDAKKDEHITNWLYNHDGYTLKDLRVIFDHWDYDTFKFKHEKYKNSWRFLDDLHLFSKKAGYEGLVLLFDEFEDIIHNLRNIAHQESAFTNLFHYYAGDKYEGMSFFAVTPSFSDQCQNKLYLKDRYHFPIDDFDDLETFRMSPLNEEELISQAEKIIDIHGMAYEWEPRKYIDMDEYLDSVSDYIDTYGAEDYVRKAIKNIVEKLDVLVEDEVDEW